jgi:hypothetical protein
MRAPPLGESQVDHVVDRVGVIAAGKIPGAVEVPRLVGELHRQLPEQPTRSVGRLAD